MNQQPKSIFMKNNQHGNALEWDGIGFLLVGPPNAGKSELSVELMARGAQLVSDDQVLLDGVTAICPPLTRGLIHLRRCDDGIISVPSIEKTEIRVIFQSPEPAAPLSRPPQSLVALGVPVIRLDLRENIAPDIIHTLLQDLRN